MISSLKHHNVREITPVLLLSLLLFASCTQLPIVEDIVDAEPQQSSQAEQQTMTEAVPLELPSDAQAEISAAPETPENPEVVALNDSLPEPGQVFSESEAASEPQRIVADEEVDAALAQQLMQEAMLHQGKVAALCEEIGGKLGSVSVEDCLLQNLQYAGASSVNDRPLTLRNFQPRSNIEEKSRILIMGGIHGDEYSSISIMFKWMQLLDESGGNSFSWRFLPAVNPDGLLDGQAVRQNASGVDLNRNFPSQDWDLKAHDYWHNSTGQNPRRFPGVAAASEPEVRWIIEQIEQYQPEVIVSVHAPYHLLDFDGPSEAPDKIGDLYLHELGVYPGSLGNYAGLDLGIPVVTLELPSAGIMPSDQQIETMWIDMLNWLNTRSSLNRSAASR